MPFAAGGPSDVAGRIIAQGLSETLGQQVVVENPAERRSPEYFAKFAAAEIDKWYGPIKVSGVSVD